MPSRILDSWHCCPDSWQIHSDDEFFVARDLFRIERFELACLPAIQSFLFQWLDSHEFGQRNSHTHNPANGYWLTLGKCAVIVMDRLMKMFGITLTRLHLDVNFAQKLWPLLNLEIGFSRRKTINYRPTYWWKNLWAKESVFLKRKEIFIHKISTKFKSVPLVGLRQP